MAEDFVHNEVKARVSAYWEGLSLDEKLSAPEEYIEKHNDILSPNIAEETVSIKANFVKVLENHPVMIKRLRELSR